MSHLWLLSFALAGVSAPAEELRDIKAWAPLATAAPLWVVVGALLIALLAALAIWWKRRKKKPAVASVIPAVPIEIQTLNRLEDLEGQIGDGNWKPFYFGFSEVIRFYVENRFHFPATDLTTDELSKILPRRELMDSTLADRFLKWMKRSDEVKFANLPSDAMECQRFLKEARLFVQETAPVKEEVKE